MIKAIDFYKEKYEIKGKKFYPLIGNWRKQFNSLMTYDQMSFLMSVIEENKIKANFNKLINDLAWWIPIRKWRDGFKNKFLI